MLEQLNAARALIKNDPEQYPSLVRGVLPIGDRPEDEIRLWCAGFIADFFRSKEISESIKSEISLEVLTILKAWVSDKNDAVAKLGVCILSEVYPRIYKQTLSIGKEMRSSWDITSQIKSQALLKWNPESPTLAHNTNEGFIASLIKFAQIVVLTHQQKASNHPVLDDVVLTAEAVGLLDRLLSLFPSNTPQTFGVLSATLNASVTLALAVPALAPRIVSYILTFDLSKRSLGTPQQMPLVLRWVGKLFKLALHPLSRNFPQIPRYQASISNYCAKQSLKRRAEEDEEEEEAPSNKNPAKRQKSVSVDLPQGSQPYKALYTLVDNMMTGFYARDLQLPMAVNMAAAGLAKISPENLSKDLNIIRQRLASTTVMTAASQDQLTREMSQDKSGAGQTNKETGESQPETQEGEEEEEEEENAGPRGPSRAALEVEVPPEFKKFDTVFNRLLGNAPIRVVSRLSARGLGMGTDIKAFVQKKMYAQLVPDFRNSLDPLVLWLSEEYYAENDYAENDKDNANYRASYFHLLSRVVDEILPRLEVSDSKTFIRLLSELPELNRDIIYKMRGTLLDPERSVIAARALKFLIMFKPPTRSDCLDLVEELSKEGVQSTKGILERFRPEAVRPQE